MRRTLMAGFMCAAQLPLGEFAQVKIIGHTDYDLIAEPAEASCNQLRVGKSHGTGYKGGATGMTTQRDMNLPNKLTVSRFVLTIAFLAVMFSQVQIPPDDCPGALRAPAGSATSWTA